MCLSVCAVCSHFPFCPSLSCFVSSLLSHSPVRSHVNTTGNYLKGRAVVSGARNWHEPREREMEDGKIGKRVLTGLVRHRVVAESK